MNISAEITKAMRAKDAARLDVLRAVKAAFQKEELKKAVALVPGGDEKRTEVPLSESEQLNILKTLIKQRLEAVVMFRNGGRNDLANKDEAQIVVLKEFLPPPVTLEELTAAVVTAIAETGASTPKQQGLVMKAIMAKFGDRPVDGKEAAKLVSEKLRG